MADAEGRHRPAPGRWDAARCLYTIGWDAGGGGAVFMYCWMSSDGLAHLSGIPPLPWVERDWAEHYYTARQRFILGVGSSENQSAEGILEERFVQTKIRVVKPADLYVTTDQQDRVGRYHVADDLGEEGKAQGGQEAP